MIMKTQIPNVVTILVAETYKDNYIFQWDIESNLEFALIQFDDKF